MRSAVRSVGARQDMVYDNIGHGADHCFPPPGYKRPKSMKRTDGVGPVGRRTNGRRTVCGKDVRASCCCLCPAQSAPDAAASVRACVRAAASAVCSQHVLLQRVFVRAAASAVRACRCVCSCVQPRRPCVRAAAPSSARAPLPLPCAVGPCCCVGRACRCCVCSWVQQRRPCVRAAASVRACSCVGRSCVLLRPFVRACCLCRVQ